MSESSGPSLTMSSNEFTAKLYQELFPVTSGEDLIFSPFSLHTVLGMVGLRAGGETRTEILKGLRIPQEKDNDKIGAAFKAIFSIYQGSSNPEKCTLLTANKIYVSNKGITVNPAFANSLRDYFLAGFDPVDFSTRGKCRETSAKINKWVESTTNGKIKNLFCPNSFDDSTRLVLVNCIYFKGLWKNKFDVAYTRNRNFTLGNGQTIQVDMMVNKKVTLAHGQLLELDAQAVSLPCKGGRLSMVIILPNEVNGLGKIQSSLGNIFPTTCQNFER